MQDGSLEIDGVLQPYILNGYVPWRDPPKPMLKTAGIGRDRAQAELISKL